MKICGDFGGKKSDGSPCGRRVKEGRCRSHTDQADELLASRKRTVLKVYEDTPLLTVAAQAAGISTVTLWRMRKDDPEFDAAIQVLEEVAPNARRQMVEDTMFTRIVKGKATGAETIFWLINDSRRRGDGRWKDVKQVEQSSFPVDLTHCSTDELERISNGEHPARVFAETRRDNVLGDYTEEEEGS